MAIKASKSCSTPSPTCCRRRFNTEARWVLAFRCPTGFAESCSRSCATCCSTRVRSRAASSSPPPCDACSTNTSKRRQTTPIACGHCSVWSCGSVCPSTPPSRQRIVLRGCERTCTAGHACSQFAFLAAAGLPWSFGGKNSDQNSLRQQFFDERHDVFRVDEIFSRLRVVVVEAFGDFAVGAEDIDRRDRSQFDLLEERIRFDVEQHVLKRRVLRASPRSAMCSTFPPGSSSQMKS